MATVARKLRSTKAATGFLGYTGPGGFRAPEAPEWWPFGVVHPAVRAAQQPKPKNPRKREEG